MNNYDKDFIAKFLEAVKNRKVIGRDLLTEDEFTNYIQTIQFLNYHNPKVLIVKGNQMLNEYKVPSFISDLITPTVTLSGVQGEINQVEWSAPKGFTPLSSWTFEEYGVRLLKMFRLSPEWVEVVDARNKIVTLASLAPRLTVDGDYTNADFQVGAYPLVPKFQIFGSNFIGLSFVRAQEIWIQRTLDSVIS